MRELKFEQIIENIKEKSLRFRPQEKSNPIVSSCFFRAFSLSDLSFYTLSFALILIFVTDAETSK